MISSAVKTKIDELVDVLDGDIRHLETALSYLDALRGLLIKRDDAALRELLGQVARHADDRGAGDRRRETLIAGLGSTLGCGADGLTLSALQAALPVENRGDLIDRQRRLKALLSELKREYRLTAILVSDCAKFNRALMRTFFKVDGVDTLTYSPSGTVRHRTNAGLMRSGYS